jgi:hypothetical protein
MFVIILFPSIRASPDVGGRRPTSIDIVVLLPAPLCPRSESIWFSYNVSCNELTAQQFPLLEA